MQEAFAVTQAGPKLGRLLDQAAKGKSVYLKRGDNLPCLDRVMAQEPVPVRPFGYFKFDDELTALADRVEPSFLT